ncbi:hypothetical protein L1787_16535 [Acuticoccus sp. M5D2P5]|uniref:hypothetical protein n=1 Tax=Acuticoccus kalidii TaxID=2910977 RepID=UPI001F434C93|nr:hypothetical protein [Acuticoccus kalidii]MCF3935013.1 hypothetical protein [Acuticoccus kalidii]
MANWFAMERLADRAIDRVFSEQIRIDPQVRSGKGERPGSDATRPAFVTRGLLKIDVGTIERGNFIGRRWEGDMEADSAKIFIQLPLMPPYDLRDGDRIVAIDRPGPPAFEVSSIARYSGRAEILVTPV